MTKQFRLALTFGRFNLLHNGHLDLFKQMAATATESAIGISTGPNNQTYRNRADIIQKCNLNDSFGTIFGLFPKRQPFHMFKETSHLHPEEMVFFLGEDQFALAKAVERTIGCATRVIPRLTSSTLVREAIDNEEWDLLAGMVPSSIISDVIQLHLTTNA